MKSTSIIIRILASIAIAVASLSPLPVAAIGSIADGASSARGTDQPTTLFGESGVFSRVSSVLLFIVGAVAVIMLIIGGLKYIVSGGDASKVQSAKNTILYALVGIIVAILAYAAVNFVIGNFIPSSSGSGIGGGTTTGGDKAMEEAFFVILFTYFPKGNPKSVGNTSPVLSQRMWRKYESTRHYSRI